MAEGYETLVILSKAKDLCNLLAARHRQRIAWVLRFAQDDNLRRDVIPEMGRNPFVTLFDAQFLLHFNTGEISCR